MKGSPDELSLVEERLDPRRTKHFEGAFTQGSGFLHVRGSFEEGLAAAPQDEAYVRLPANVTLEQPRHPRSKWGTYVPGITGRHPLLREDLVNLPYFMDLRMSADGEPLDMDRCTIEGYERRLDLRDAVLRRRFTWKTAGGAALEASYMRYVSRARGRVCVQEVEYICASGRSTLHIAAGIDARVRTNGHDHFTRVDGTAHGGRTDVLLTTDMGDSVAICSEVRAGGLVFAPESTSHRRPAVAAESTMQAGKAVRIIKISAVATSRDPNPGPSLQETAASDVERAFAQYAVLYGEHAALWDAMGKRSAVRIEGDAHAQKALNFALYHLLRAGNAEDPRTPICAKGFTGEAYFGHFFWDTEIYMLPFFLYSRPEVARALLEFRISTLAGARRNAATLGYEGARYPWESSITGDEQCPNWQYADHEVHVTADVVHGIRHYVAATADVGLLSKAAEALVETSRYWAGRVERRNDGSVNLNGVMGPDEYTCFSNNNAYTNEMVRRALRYTLEALRTLKQKKPEEHAVLVEALRITPGELSEIERIAAALPVRTLPGGVVMQCDHFEDLEDVDFSRVWTDRSRSFGHFASQERMYRSKCLKQADALMLAYLFPADFPLEKTAANYDYYEPLTTHDSSLSCVIHSILAARLGRKEEAWSLFSRSLGIDLDVQAGGAAEGIHMANCGGMWQAVVFGFAGMQWAYESPLPRFEPRLPDHWKCLEFPLCWAGREYAVRITPSKVELREAHR